MQDNQRQDIADRIAAGEARHAALEEPSMMDRAGETAIEAKDRISAFVHEHPLTTLAGAVAAGILISGLFPRSPTRRAGVKAAGYATLGAEAAMAFLNDVLEAATHAANEAGEAAADAGRAGMRGVSKASRAGARGLEDLGDSIADTARSVGRSAAQATDSAAETARTTQRDARKGIRRTLFGSN